MRTRRDLIEKNYEKILFLQKKVSAKNYPKWKLNLEETKIREAPTSEFLYARISFAILKRKNKNVSFAIPYLFARIPRMYSYIALDKKFNAPIRPDDSSTFFNFAACT